MRNENCFKLGLPKTYMIVFLVIAITVSSFSVGIFAAPGSTLNEKVEETQGSGKEKDDNFDLAGNGLYYPKYLAAKDKEDYTNYKGAPVETSLKDVVLLPEGLNHSDYIQNGYTTTDTGSVKKYDGEFFIWNDRNVKATEDQKPTVKTAEFSFDVKQKAYYNIEITYYAPKGSVQTPQRSLNIDGKLPFVEAATVDFNKLWKDQTKNPGVNTVGDQIRPKQEQEFVFRTIRVNDHDGKYNEPLRFALDAGIHKIQLLLQYESLVIQSIKLVEPKEVPTYQEKLSQWKSSGYTEATEPIRVEGEMVTYKSDASMRMDGSSDPAAYPPYENGSVRLNVIGGTNWKSSNQTLTWNFNAPKAGLYKISLRAYAKFTDGIPVYRQVKVNGEVPYKELECYEIPFDDWNCFSFNDKDGNPLLIYLNEGDNTFDMTVKLGVIADIMNALEEDAGKLSALVQDITKITTTNPDPNFDYKLNEKIPDMNDRFQTLIDSFGTQIDRISSLSAKRPSAVNNFIMMQEQFTRMVKNVEIVTKNYTDLTTAMANLATWIKEFGSLPLQIDYIEFLPPDAEVKVVKSTFWQKLTAAVSSFMISFVKDYDSVGGMSKNEEGQDVTVLDVWVSRGKEWAEILKQQSDEEFYRKNNITIKMNVLPSGQLNASASSVLLLALASGTGPDVALGVASNLPVEYGMRGAIQPLNGFENFEEVKKRFLDGIMIPFYFKEEYYGLPETMDFQCLYYRKDLKEAYNMEIPNTWEDVYSKILPVLKQYNMDFYYAGGYNPFLFQNGGEFFKDNDLKSAWNSDSAIQAFKQWTDLYTVYDIPVTADFYNRFRSGQMPMGIGGIDVYTKLVSAAPEISGKWGVASIPGIPVVDKNGMPVLDQDGNAKVNRAAGGGTTACIILKDSQHHEEAWKFLEWYTSTETQVTYANDIKTIIGPEAIWASANREAFSQLPWDAELRDVIEEYQDWYKDAPNVVGGYIVARYLENARVAVVVDKKPYRPSLEKAVREIDRELEIKNQEFDRRAKLEAEKAQQENK